MKIKKGRKYVSFHHRGERKTIYAASVDSAISQLRGKGFRNCKDFELKQEVEFIDA